MKALYKTALVIIFIFSAFLLLVNLYGLTQDIRPNEITHEQLRFGEKDVKISREELFAVIQREPQESETDYSDRLTKLIADGLAHIHWDRYEPSQFNQLVPVWDNWIIHAMGRFSGIPEYERYHFSNPYRSLQRGIGICGDASMIMTQLLEENGIEADMLTFPGHVVVSANVDGEAFIFDPDFGVVLPFSPQNLNANAKQAASMYTHAGYTPQDVDFFVNAYSTPPVVWTGPEEFITKKFYFEKVAYVFKWLIPVIGLFFCGYFIRKLGNS